MILLMEGGLTVPNKNKIDLATVNARKPAEGALNSSGNTLEQHASNAVSEVQTALNQAISSISESNVATNSQALEKARQQLTRAEEFLDQAITSANALRLPDQQ
jgi:multidrug resistance efflux pump